MHAVVPASRMAALPLSADAIESRFLAHMKADALARRVERRHELPDRIENDAKPGVIFLFQLLQFPGKVGVSA
jgi:hypothetical protein